MSRQFRQTFKDVFFKCKPKITKSTNGVAYSSINTQTTKV
jgi:hypothetical protein